MLSSGLEAVTPGLCFKFVVAREGQGHLFILGDTHTLMFLLESLNKNKYGLESLSLGKVTKVILPFLNSALAKPVCGQ